MRTRGLAPAASVGLVLAATLLSGCSSDVPAPGPTKVTAASALAAAKAKVDAATSLHLTITGKDLPEKMTGVISADGVGTHAPAFKGTFQVRINGTQASTDVTAVDGKVYVKLPFTSIQTEVDPKTLGVPNPSALFTADTGLTSLLTATTSPVDGPQVRKGSEVLSTYTGTLSGARIADLLVIGDRASSFKATYGVTESSGELRTVDLTGPFFAGTESTYSVTFDSYGAPVEITKP